MTRSHAVRITAVAAALGAASLALAACGNSSSTPNSPNSSSAGTSAKVSGQLAGGGSSAQQNIQKAWASAFSQANSGATVSYDSVGSGAGRTGLASGKYAFAGTDAAMSASDLTAAKQYCGASGAIDIPVYIDPIAVVFNLNGVKSLNLDPATLTQIFTGKITTWNDPAIAKDNPGVTLPSTAITTVHRSDNSGTTSNFSDYLNKVDPTDWATPSNGNWPSNLKGQSGNGTSGLLAVVNGAQGTIGYADYSQVGNLGTVKVQVGSSWVAPSTDGAAALATASPLDSTRAANDIVVKLDRKPTDASQYPITLVSYLAVCSDYSSASNGATVGPLVKAYAQYVTSQAAQSTGSGAVGSAPLTGTLLAKAQATAAQIKG